MYAGDSHPYRIRISDIQKYCSHAAVFENGRAYWFNGYVSNVDYDPESHTFTAFVHGSERYHVSGNIRENTTINASCTCPAYYSYSGYCKHIIAVLFGIYSFQSNTNYAALLQQSEAQRAAEERHKTNQIIDMMDKFQPLAETESAYNPRVKQIDSQEQACVEYTVHLHQHVDNEYTLNVSLRMGSNRLYVVRNVFQLLKDIHHQQPHLFTKRFTYDPDTHYFHETDARIVDLLIESVHHQTFFDRLAEYRRTERYVSVSPHVSDELLQLIRQRDHVLKIQDQVIDDHFHWQETNPDFDYTLDRVESAYRLSMADLQHAYVLPAYRYVFHEGTFYKVSQPTMQLCEELQQLLGTEGELLIQGDQIDSVVSTVVPRLNRIGNVYMTDSISEHIVAPPLQAKVHIHPSGQNIEVTLEYHYDRTVINPMKNTPVARGDHILMRDSETEQQVMHIIENSPLKWNGSCMYVQDELDVATFLFETIPQLEAYCTIFMADSIGRMRFEPSALPQPNIDLNSSNNLLEINFEIDGIEAEDIQHLLQSLIEKKRYYRLSSGQLISLENETFESLGQLFSDLDIRKQDIHGSKAQTHAVRGLQMDQTIEKEAHTFKFGKQLRDVLTHIKHPEDLQFSVPHPLQNVLRDYQHTGFQWLKMLAHYRFGGILADDMGLGKTLQAITYIVSEKEQASSNNKKPVLVIAPASLVYNWKKECASFAPELNVAIVAGPKQQREQTLLEIENVDAVITSYPLIRRDYASYTKHHFHTLILDEAQAIKNDQTQTAQAVKTISATNRFALSGTPIENKLDELWSIFQVVLPGLFPSKRKFNSLPQEKIGRMCRPFILRRLKQDVLHELPDKIETLHTSELTTDQKHVYLAYLEKIQLEAKQSLASNGFQQSRMQILAGLTRLRQICCHPATFLENYDGFSGKLEQLLSFVEESLASGRRLLIFSQFTSMLALIRREFEQRNYDYFYIDGKTDPQERVDITEKFNNGEHALCLVSLKAGGTGLNLTGADTVVLYDLWWNPAVDQQAIDRAHRIGQKNVVQVVRFITEGTIEERIYDLQQKKKSLIENVVQSSEDTFSSLNEEDIRHILDIN